MTPAHTLPTHLTLKLYRSSYDALYRQMQLLRVQEVADITKSRDMVAYFETDKQWTTVLIPLWLHDWKAPDQLTRRPGKPASIRLRLDLCLVLYGYLESINIPVVNPLNDVFQQLHQLLINTTVVKPDTIQLPVGKTHNQPRPVGDIINQLRY